MASISLLILLSLSVCSAHNVSAVQFAVMVSSRADLNTTGIVLSAVGDAVEVVNRNILSKGVALKYETIVTDCYNVSSAKQLLTKLLNISVSPPVAVLGGGCSLVTQHIANDSAVSRIPIISYYSTSPLLDDSSYSLLFRMRPSDSSIPLALASIFKQYGWSQVAVATQISSQYNKMYQLLNSVLQSTGITISQHSTFTFALGSDLSGVNEFLETESHIFFLNCDPKIAAIILCQAYRKGLYYPNYMWITLGWYPPNWWNNIHTGCRANEMERILYRSFSISSVHSLSSHHSIGSYVYDGVYALALAINNTITDKGIKNLTHHVSQALISVEFDGLTGNIKFNGINNDTTKVLIEQYRRNSSNDLIMVRIAYYSANESALNYLDNVTTTDIFPDGIPPDGTPIKILNTVHIGIVVVIVIMQVVGLVIAFLCLLLNILFRSKKIIKLNSPNLNYVIIAGVTVMMVGLMFYFLPAQSNSAVRFFCTIRRIFTSLGHDIAFTVALVKTWRVHYIFRSPSMSKKAPSDSKLLLVVILIVAVESLPPTALLISDVVYSPVGTTVDRERPSTVNEQGVDVQYCIVECGTTYFYLSWVVLVAIIKIISHVVAVTLAFRIRRIEVDAINDYKYTSAIVYISTVLILVLVIDIFVLNSYVNTFVMCTTLLIFSEGIVFLSLSFIPKMIALYKDPKGEYVFSHQTGVAPSCNKQSSDNSKDKVSHLPLSPTTLSPNTSSVQVTTDSPSEFGNATKFNSS